MANSVDPEQTAPIGAVCSGSTLFASILYSSVMLGNFLQQTTSADDILRFIFSWRFKGEASQYRHTVNSEIFTRVYAKFRENKTAVKGRNHCRLLMQVNLAPVANF